MTVAFAPTFFSSMSDLEPKEQARTIEFVTKFQQNPAHPSLSLERLRTKDKSLWSGRITQGLRAILHKDGDLWSLLHAGQHDAAYKWAERRNVSKHPVTGLLQVVETIESTKEVQQALPPPEEVEKPTFAEHSDEYMLSLGVPEDWMPTVRRVADDDQLLLVIEKLPEDVAERLMSLAAGEFVTPPAPIEPDKPLAENPEFRRRFFVAEDSDELLRALEAPMERWIAFLHPSQRKLVEGVFKGPAKVTGGAGTGKTVVAMHRARHLARQGKKVLLTSYVRTLCSNIERALALFCSPEEFKNITVSTVHSQAIGIARQAERDTHPATDHQTHALLDDLARREAPSWDRGFVRSEWDNVIAVQGIRSWDEYRKAKRTGRGRALSVKDRKALWAVFGGLRARQEKKHQFDWPALCLRALDALEVGTATSPFDAVVVDETQDLKGPELRFLAALSQPEHLMLVGDAGQRIYPGGFGLSSLGINVRGRSSILRINYRTTEEIRRAADRMLGASSDDMDEGEEDRTKTRSLLKGPEPTLRGFEKTDQEHAAVADQVKSWLAEGLKPSAIGIFARSKKLRDGVADALKGAGISSYTLDSDKEAPASEVQVGTMHRAKGLEFKAVAVAGCHDSQLPNLAVVSNIDDPQDREEAIARERRLLYVAMTRARDELLVTWTGTPSRFLARLTEARA